MRGTAAGCSALVLDLIELLSREAIAECDDRRVHQAERLTTTGTGVECRERHDQPVGHGGHHNVC